MTVLAYVGLPGSGKSYDVVENQILPALKAGRVVVTNVPMVTEEILKEIPTANLIELPLDTIRAEPERIFEYVKPGCLLVLDEAWRIWPAGDKVNKVPEAFKKLLAEHRHMVDAAGDSMQIVIVVQDLGNLGAFAVRMVEKTFNHTKLTTLGLDKQYRIDIYEGAVKGPNYPTSNRVRDILGSYKPEVYRFYKSHMYSAAAKSGANEKALDRRGNIFRRPILIVGAVAVVGLTWFGLHMIGVTERKVTAYVKPQAKPAATSAVPPANIIEQTATHILEAHGDGYRVVGIIERETGHGDGVALLAKTGGLPVKVASSACRMKGLARECLYEGFWYSESGASKPDHEQWALDPTVTLSKSGDAGPPRLVTSRTPESTHVELEVLPAAHGDPVDGSEQLRVLAGNDAGLALRGPARSGSRHANGGS